MYFKYSWQANITLTQVINDIVSIICSTAPDSSILSAGCDKPFSTLLANTAVSNWTVWDSAAAVNSQVLRSLNADGTTYKYVQITLTATTIALLGWESWNAATHVGLNPSSCGSAAAVPMNVSFLSFATANNISIIATPRSLNIVNAPLVSSTNAFLYEVTRDGLSLDATYPCLVTGDYNSHFVRQTSTNLPKLAICRIKNPNANNDHFGNTLDHTLMLLNFTTANTSIISYAQNTGTFGINGQLNLLTLPIQLGYCSTASIVNIGTVLGGILLMPSNTLAYSSLDELAIAGITYVLIKSSNNGTILIPKA